MPADQITPPEAPSATFQSPPALQSQEVAKTVQAGGFQYEIDQRGVVVDPDPAKRVTPGYHYLTNLRAQVGPQSFDQSKAFARHRAAFMREQQDPRNMAAFGVQIEREKQRNIQITETLLSGNVSAAMQLAKTPDEMAMIQQFALSGKGFTYQKNKLELESLRQEVHGQPDRTPLPPEMTPFVDAAAHVTVQMADTKREGFNEIVNRYLRAGQPERAFEVMEAAAVAELGQEAKNSYHGDKTLLKQLDNIEGLLSEFVGEKDPRKAYGLVKQLHDDNPRQTGVVLGALENLANRFGDTSDPDVANINNAIQVTRMFFRKAMSGAAFTESEAKEYEKAFPGVGKKHGFNMELIRSLRNTTAIKLDSILSSLLGEHNVAGIHAAIDAENDHGVAPAVDLSQFNGKWVRDPVNKVEAFVEDGKIVKKRKY